MVYCSALNCRNATSGVNKNSSVSFFGFPLQNEALLRQWIQNMGRDMETPSKYQRLCSEHFEESSFETGHPERRKSRRLLKEAVPKKFILGEDGSWLVGTPQAFGDVKSNKSRKRIRNSEPCGVSGMLPQWPRLQDWQNEFYKQLLKEKYGSWIALGKDFPVPKGQILAGGAALVKDPQDLKGRQTPASLNSGHAGATTQGAGSPLGTPQALPWHGSNQAETSGGLQNPASPAGLGSVAAGRELDEFRRFLLHHLGRPEEAAAVPWFICTECGKSFARHAYLLRHQRAHTSMRPHACAECGHRFLDKPALHRHLRTHFHIIRVPQAFLG